MIHDIFIPFVAEKFEEMGFTKLWDPDKVVLIYDHLVPTSAVEDIRHFKIGDAFADKYSLTHVHRRDGICHQLMTEAGYAKPGNIVFGTDSHTTTYGCVGCFSSGIGYTAVSYTHLDVYKRQLKQLAKEAEKAGVQLCLPQIQYPGYGFQYLCNIADTGFLSLSLIHIYSYQYSYLRIKPLMKSRSRVALC